MIVVVLLLLLLIVHHIHWKIGRLFATRGGSGGTTTGRMLELLVVKKLLLVLVLLLGAHGVLEVTIGVDGVAVKHRVIHLLARPWSHSLDLPTHVIHFCVLLLECLVEISLLERELLKLTLQDAQSLLTARLPQLHVALIAHIVVLFALKHERDRLVWRHIVVLLAEHCEQLILFW